MALWRKPLQRNAGKSITDESGRAGSGENDLCQKKKTPLQNTTCASRFTAQVTRNFQKFLSDDDNESLQSSSPSLT